MIRALTLSIALFWAPAAAMAEASLARLQDLLALDDYVSITREEGMVDGIELAEGMLGRSADSMLQDQLSRIYDTARMAATVMEHLETLTEAEVSAAIDYFQTDAALRITELEVAARRAMMDEEVEESARLAWVEAETTQPETLAQIEEMTRVNDLVERNVSGALNSNLRYYQGLAEGGGVEFSEEEILALVWGQEEDIRDDTRAWLGGYFLLAYESVETGDLDTYIAFWKTPAGQALNRVIFAGFNEVYDDVSYATGRVIALNMLSQEL